MSGKEQPRTEHVLEAGGRWTNDGSSTASVSCDHPRCTFWTKQGGHNDDPWPGYDWDNDRPLTTIYAEAKAAHDSWLAGRTLQGMSPLQHAAMTTPPPQPEIPPAFGGGH